MVKRDLSNALNFSMKKEGKALAVEDEGDEGCASCHSLVHILQWTKREVSTPKSGMLML